MTEHALVWFWCLVVVFLIGLAAVAAIVMVEELDRYQLEKCFEQSDVCFRENGVWYPGTKWDDV